MADPKGMQPHGDSLRRALRWLSERRQEEPKAARLKLIEEAALRERLPDDGVAGRLTGRLPPR
jgi:hypothetical protein